MTGKNDYHGFGCKNCSAENQATEDQAAVPNDFSDPCFWASLTEDKTRNMFEEQNKIVHWKPVFFTLGKNKSKYEFVNQFNILLQLSTCLIEQAGLEST